MQNTNLVPLVVAGVAIRQDAEGRYCLNDLHDAAIKEGANQRTKEPAKFLSSPQIIDLAKEIKTTQNLGSLPAVTIMGRNGGTYVCRELVYAYAMWIRPIFHLKVIRAYDAIVRGDFSSDYLPAILQEIDRRLSARLVDLEATIETRIHGELAKQRTGIRHGVTAGQVWHDHGLPTNGLRGYPSWFGNRLAERGCIMDEGSHAADDRQLRQLHRLVAGETHQGASCRADKHLTVLH